MTFTINGEEKSFEATYLTVTELLNLLELPFEHIAVELNKEIIPKVQFSHCKINEGDRVEIVRFVGGGKK